MRISKIALLKSRRFCLIAISICLIDSKYYLHNTGLDFIEKETNAHLKKNTYNTSACSQY